MSLGNSYLDNDVTGEITGICFQKVDEGKVNPVIDTDEFLKVDWPCAPTKPAVQHLYLELDYHSVPSQKWQLFVDVMANLRTALLVQVIVMYNTVKMTFHKVWVQASPGTSSVRKLTVDEGGNEANTSSKRKNTTKGEKKLSF